MARGSVADMADLLPKPPETPEDRDARVDRNIDLLNLRFAAMAEADADGAGSDDA